MNTLNNNNTGAMQEKSVSRKGKKKILFVDDDNTILDGLRRALRSMRKEWDMYFVNSGKEALKVLETATFDIVVSDMRMPGMDGAELLNEVRMHHPNTIRIILSGQADDKAIMRSAGSMHQFLSKPCEIYTIKAVIDRACSLQNFLNGDRINRLVLQIDSLPSYPKLYQELMDELKSEDCSIDKIGEIISKDAGMSAKILQLANSAFFGFSQQIATPAHAAQILGLDVIQPLVLSYQVFSSFDPKNISSLSMDRLWDHSLAVAKGSLDIAKSLNADENIRNFAFTAGLIHEIGCLILASKLPELYGKAIAIAKERDVQLWHTELEMFNTTHSQVGAFLLGLWGLPDPIVEAVGYHPFPSRYENREITPLTLVHIANALAHEANPEIYGAPGPGVDESYLETLGLLDRLQEFRDICNEKDA